MAVTQREERMTTIQRVAQVFGAVFILIALAGFVWDGGLTMTATMGPEQPRLFGIFPINILHNVVHLAFGIWGLAASRTFGAAKTYAIAAGAIYLLLAVLGFVAPTMFGLVPIGGNDIWLHALLAVALLGFGVAARPTVTVDGRAVA
jgi:hypothetical protein